MLPNELLAGHVLTHIEDTRNQDDRALDDVGDVAGDAQEGHAGDNQLHHKHAEDNAADLTGAADEGNAADNRRRDRVSLVVQAEGRGGGAEARGLDKAGVAVEREIRNLSAHSGLGQAG